MIESLQDDLYQLEKKNRQKVLNFVLTSEDGGRKMLKNFFQST